MSKLWSKNFPGNLHQVADRLNSWNELEPLRADNIVCMDTSGHNTVVVFCVTEKEFAKMEEKRKKING